MADPSGMVPGGQLHYAMQPGMVPYTQAAPAAYAQPPAMTSFHHQQQQQQQAAHLKSFWIQQMQEIEQVSHDPAEFKNHQLPLARIKKIMKSDEDVRMISAEAPVLFAKACDMFILELTLRSWIHSEENKRRTLQRNDIAAAITKTDIFDFLVDIVPRDDKPEGEGAGGVPGVAGVQPPMPAMQPVGAMPYYIPGQTTMVPMSDAMRPVMAPTMMYSTQYMPQQYMQGIPGQPMQQPPPGHE